MRQLVFSKILNHHGVSQGVDLNSTKSNESSICSAKVIFCCNFVCINVEVIFDFNKKFNCLKLGSRRIDIND